MDRMTKTFVTVDVIIAAVLLAIEAAVLIRFRKKKA
jgi:hypothetical protein